MKVGDFVIHRADAKRPDILMRVVNIGDDGRIGTVYHHHPEWKSYGDPDGIWRSWPHALLDPRDYQIDIPVVKMSNKFTAIYTDSWTSGRHQMTITRMKRVEQKDGETVSDMLRREDIEDCIVYLFHGHPLMHGEERKEYEH